MRNGSWNSWLRLSGKDTPEVRLLEHYRRLPDRKLHKKYLEFCWTLPYYGYLYFIVLWEKILFLHLFNKQINK